MDKNIDIRILKLNKRHVPKTFELEEQDGHIAVGYFDVVEVQGIQENSKSVAMTVTLRVRHAGVAGLWPADGSASIFGTTTPTPAMRAICATPPIP